MDLPKITEIIKAGGLVILPTDTIYGLMASAQNPAARERLITVRGREAGKPFITLLADQSELIKFNLTPNKAQQEFLNRWWPGPVSVILNGQAFRVPAPAELRQLLGATGPLIAPSANPPGQPPATTVAEARAYFGDQIDLYVDGGRREGSPSTVVRLGNNGETEVLRGILKP